jgi:hypothetical protein
MRITEITGQRPASSDIYAIPMLIRSFNNYLGSPWTEIINPPRKPTELSLSLPIPEAIRQSVHMVCQVMAMPR